MTHVICIHCARVNLTFGVFLPKSGIHTVNACWLHVPDIKFIDLLVFLNYVITNSWSRCQATGIASAIILCITCWGLVFMVTPKYEVSRTTQYWVITFLFEYVTWLLTFACAACVCVCKTLQANFRAAAIHVRTEENVLMMLWIIFTIARANSRFMVTTVKVSKVLISKW